MSDLDCDYFAIRMNTQSFGKLGQFYRLTNHPVKKLMDPRVRGCVAITMDPIQLLADCPRDHSGDCLETEPPTVARHRGSVVTRVAYTTETDSCVDC